MIQSTFHLRITGNWCSGYYAEIWNPITDYVLRSFGPFNERFADLQIRNAKNEAIAWAFKNDIPLEIE